MATNDITGDELRSRVNTEAFQKGWDAIKFEERLDEELDEDCKERLKEMEDRGIE